MERDGKVANQHKRGFALLPSKHSKNFKRREWENCLFISLWLSRDFDSVNTGPRVCGMWDGTWPNDWKISMCLWQSLSVTGYRQDIQGQEQWHDHAAQTLLCLVSLRPETAQPSPTPCPKVQILSMEVAGCGLKQTSPSRPWPTSSLKWFLYLHVSSLESWA